MERDKLLYELEYEVQELRHQQINKIKYNTMTIKELLDLGFDSSFIRIGDNWYNLGYKWYGEKLNDKQYCCGYDSNDFGELTEEQLNCEVEYVDSEIGDYNYQQVSVELVNSEDEEKFGVNNDN